MLEAATAGRMGWTEADLIAQAKNLRPEAWEAIYEMYYPKMYAFLYTHVGDRAAAEDLAGEVFEQACKGIHRFQYRGAPLLAWFYRIAHNVMVDFFKRRRRVRFQPIDADMPEAAVDDATESVSLRDQLSRALRRLTREQQHVLVLRHLEGHSVASTALIMGKKENAVRALEFRAVHSLRRILDREERRSR